MKVREFTIDDIRFIDPDSTLGVAAVAASGADYGYAEACKDHQDVFDACQALYDHFISHGGNPDSLLGIKVLEALKKAKGE